ncbi:hypothetical protein H4R20_004371 [Coemansia guatemalensis]|uniref:Uncharacterized protein n=1 Tax=Coemansia guatemalensis TaxID=2761395 RepID=A0A9W8LSU4_9FUNG|nr:hypothetical protein H4R20_004371 [Coemansia guatemalensis]
MLRILACEPSRVRSTAVIRKQDPGPCCGCRTTRQGVKNARRAGHHVGRRRVRVWAEQWCGFIRILGNVFKAANTIPGPDARAPKGSAAERISPSEKCMAAGGEEGLQRDKR